MSRCARIYQACATGCRGFHDIRLSVLPEPTVSPATWPKETEGSGNENEPDCICIVFQFDRFRRKLIEYTFSGGASRTIDRELDDDELLDHVRQMAHDKVSLVDEIKQYASSESEVSTAHIYVIMIHLIWHPSLNKSLWLIWTKNVSHRSSLSHAKV